MAQRSLFTETAAGLIPAIPSGEPPCQHHSPTSREAAKAIAPSAQTLRGQVLAWFRSLGEHGATDEQLCDHFGGTPGTWRARRIELTQAGLLRDSSNTREARSGRQAVVWVIV